MTDLKLTKNKIVTFDGHEKISALKAPTKLVEFGERQNEANELLADNITELIKRVSALEEKQAQNTEVMRRIAEELSAFKKELDRVRLSEKLNSGTIERLSNALRLAEEGGQS
jgi:predicted house-cleaning noncanonical NTP pyrophosphatase (MazG superfamily)